MIDHDALGASLYNALRSRTTLPPLTGRVPGLTLEDSYRISEAMLRLRLADGERIIGKKIGVTSPAAQKKLGATEPDFGTLTDAMIYQGSVPISEFQRHPRAEGEIAFTLKHDLLGPGITPAEVLAATETVHPAFEIVDSRIADWQIAIEDTVADNASAGLFVLGEGVPVAGVDFAGCRMVLTKNGSFLSEGRGSNALGSPLLSMAWLANTLGARGKGLKAGEIILTGSLVPQEPLVPGDHLHVAIEGIGETEVRFT
jgi:2-oxopent-4-enoate/cis-2-oxohex-4-enoate hydratase